MEDVSVIISTNFAASKFRHQHLWPLLTSHLVDPPDRQVMVIEMQAGPSPNTETPVNYNTHSRFMLYSCHRVKRTHSWIWIFFVYICLWLFPWQSCACVSYQSHCGLVHDTDIATFSYSIGWNDLNQLLFAYVCDLFFGQNAYLFRFHWDLNH